MEKKLFINFIDYYKDDVDSMLDIIKDVGFDGVNFSWNKGVDYTLLVNKIRGRGLLIDYIHGPYLDINHFWYETSEVKDVFLNTLKECIDFTKSINVDKVVIHPFIGFEEHNPTEIGILYFERLLQYAKEKDILLCFENVEGDEYLSLIFERLFNKYDNARFCLDTGHELCYNRGVDQLAKYGRYLSCTHINDNIGVTGENITWTDDLHYIPYDGILDVDNLIQRLKVCEYKGDLSLELKINKTGSTPIYEKYIGYSKEEYFKKAYEVLVYIKNQLLK